MVQVILETINVWNVIVLNLQNKSTKFLQFWNQELAEKDPGNTNTLCDYIIAEQNEINIKESTKEQKIKNLLSLLKFVDSKNFKEIAKQDVLDFLIIKENQNLQIQLIKILERGIIYKFYS